MFERRAQSESNAHERGFTLIEMLISIAIFTIVMTMSIGALLVVNSAFQKTRLIKSAMENAGITLETMAKKIRVGDTYHCGTPGNTKSPWDCEYIGSGSSSNYFTFRTGVNNYVEYKHNPTNETVEMRTCDASGNPSSWCNSPAESHWGQEKTITSPELRITSLEFNVHNSEDVEVQPWVLITMTGFAEIPGAVNDDLDTTFYLQTIVSQRVVNF